MLVVGGCGTPAVSSDAKRVALFATHPIQNQVPWYRALAARQDVDLTVYFGTLPDAERQGVGFGVPFEWDIPMLEGYRWEVLSGSDRRPDLSRFAAIRFRGVRKALRTSGAQAVIVTGWHSLCLVQALVAARSIGLPVLARGESNALRGRSLPKRVIHRLLLGAYDAHLAVGISNRQFLEQNGVASGRIFAAPYCIDGVRFPREAERARPHRVQQRARLGVPGDAACLVFVGKLIDKKRPFDVIEALERAANGARRLHLLMVGDGPLRPAIAERVRRRRLPVTLTGFANQSALAELYVCGDCLVLPSDHRETWGLVVNEAMACGLPALVSDQVGCGPDLVRDGLTGRVFPCGDVDQLVQQLNSVATEPALWREMGVRAQQLVAESYSPECAARGTVQAIEALLRPRAAQGATAGYGKRPAAKAD